MTTDPAGSGRNWYAYANGDPINFNDPRGLDSWWAANVMHPGDLDGGGWGWSWGIDAWGLLPWEPLPLPGGDPLGSVPEMPITKKEHTDVELKVAIAAEAALVIAATLSDETPYITTLRVLEDCWLPSTSISVSYTRTVTYGVYDQNDRRIRGQNTLSNFTIKESFPLSEGNANFTRGLANPASWSVGRGLLPDGTFNDFLSSNGTAGGSAIQTFTSYAFASLGVPYVQPLKILGFDQPAKGQYSLLNTYSPGMVTVNQTTTGRRCEQEPLR